MTARACGIQSCLCLRRQSEALSSASSRPDVGPQGKLRTSSELPPAVPTPAWLHEKENSASSPSRSPVGTSALLCLARFFPPSSHVDSRPGPISRGSPSLHGRTTDLAGTPQPRHQRAASLADPGRPHPTTTCQLIHGFPKDWVPLQLFTQSPPLSPKRLGADSLPTSVPNHTQARCAF